MSPRARHAHLLAGVIDGPHRAPHRPRLWSFRPAAYAIAVSLGVVVAVAASLW